jgi:hypothetical protein
VAKESGRKRPDFLIKYGKSSAIVEAKLKGDDPVKVKEREEALSTVGLHETDHVMGRDETISGVVANAARQLRMESEVSHDYKIVLIIAACINAPAVGEVVIDTLYGRTSVIDVENGMTSKPCYFYRNSDFFRRQVIDAAIVGHATPSSDRVIVKICLNPYSSRYADRANSDLLQPFNDAILDPIKEERLGHAYLLDKDVERREHLFTKMFATYDPVMHHLQKKYRTGRLIRGDFHVPQITLRPRDDPYHQLCRTH